VGGGCGSLQPGGREHQAIVTDTLRVSFEVGCGMDHAFATWTERIGTWWPADHTLSGRPVLIVLEGRVGRAHLRAHRAG
jgi:hypothetical protein